MLDGSPIAQKKQDTLVREAGHLWGLGFGDFAYKAKSDALNRGGTNQYTGIEKTSKFISVATNILRIQ